MNAIFWFSKANPRRTATIPMIITVLFETFISSASVAWPFLITIAYKSCAIELEAASARPATTARIVANATAEINPKKIEPPVAWAKWTAAMLFPPINLPAASK